MTLWSQEATVEVNEAWQRLLDSVHLDIVQSTSCVSRLSVNQYGSILVLAEARKPRHLFVVIVQRRSRLIGRTHCRVQLPLELIQTFDLSRLNKRSLTRRIIAVNETSTQCF